MTWQSKLSAALVTFVAGLSKTDMSFPVVLGYMLLIAVSSSLMLILFASRKSWKFYD